MTKQEQDQVSKKANAGLELLNSVLQRVKKIMTEEAEVNNNGDVEILEPEELFPYLFEDEKFGDAVEEAVKEFYEELSDQVTCEERQVWAHKREKRRTDHSEYVAEKNRVANKINKKYN